MCFPAHGKRPGPQVVGLWLWQQDRRCQRGLSPKPWQEPEQGRLLPRALPCLVGERRAKHLGKGKGRHRFPLEDAMGSDCKLITSAQGGCGSSAKGSRTKIKGKTSASVLLTAICISRGGSPNWLGWKFTLGRMQQGSLFKRHTSPIARTHLSV